MVLKKEIKAVGDMQGVKRLGPKKYIGDMRKYRRLRPEIQENIGDLDLKYRRNIRDLT